MAIKWDFAPSKGSIKGINDAGIETFKNNLLQSLARETCQNSLDASNGNGPVVVEFQMYKSAMPKDIPGYNDILDSFKKMYNFWKNSGEVAKNFLERAIDILEGCSLNVLRISDKNTVGLLNPYPNSDYKSLLTSKWHKLITIDGGGGEEVNHGGGFGIGKNAPFANSILRLVFYRTLNSDGIKAAQGVARLLSYPDDINNAINTLHDNIGYYGETINHMPVESIQALDNLNKRTEIGTDLFIYGFNGEYVKNWKKDIIITLLSNFMVSIFKERIVIKVEDVVIDKNNLAQLINDYVINVKTAEAKSCYSNYLVLTSEKTKIIKYDFPKNGSKLGTAVLSLLVDPKADLDKRVLRTRASGMTLFAPKESFVNISFSGILELEGDPLKRYFKQLEPPEHNKWLKDRNEKNPEEAGRYIKELEDFIKSQIREVGMASGATELSVEGLSGMLSMNKDGDSSEGAKESLESPVDKIEIKLPDKKYYDTTTGVFISTDGKEKSNNKKETAGRLDDSFGKYGAKKKRTSDRKIKNKGKHRGSLDDNGDINIEVPEYNVNQTPLKNLIIMREGNSSSYTLIFTLPKTIDSGYIEIGPIGEKVSKKTKITFKIISAMEIHNCENLTVSNGNIEFSHIIGEAITKIRFELSGKYNYSMGVKVYEYNK